MFCSRSALQVRILAFALLAFLLWPSGARALASEVIPPAPKDYFTDYAGAVSPEIAARLNQKLQNFERETSSQILVVVYPKMQSDSSIEDYTVRVAQSWKVGQKAKDNGAVLFVFIQDRKMFLQVGYGLEGALPDALAKQIIENEIKPRFRAGDYGGGLTAGVDAILAAARGEYKGTGRTAAESGHQNSVAPFLLIVFILVFIIVLFRVFGGSRGTIYGRRGYHSSWGGWGSGGGWGGGGWGGGGGGGGFSGGGGSFGGGGAGGSW